MTHNPDGIDPDDPDGQTPGEGGRKLDEDAAWRDIVEHYGDRPNLDDDPPTDDAAVPEQPEPPARPPVLEPGWQDSLNSRATWDDEGHFVPPEPPPMPPIEPRRRAAWIGLFGAPTLMLLFVVFGVYLPTWAMVTLLASFVGGFAYLVATMQRKGPGDGGYDDGAVV